MRTHPLLLLLSLAACSAPAVRTAPSEPGSDPGLESPELLDRLEAASERADPAWSEPIQVDEGISPRSQWEPHWGNGHFMALIGQRMLDDPDLDSIDSQTDLALVWDANAGGPFQIEAGIYYATASSTKFLSPTNTIGISTETIEGNVGLNKWFRVGRSPLHLFGSLGASFLWTEGELQTNFNNKDSDTSLGYYGRLGAVFFLGRSGQFLGLDYRYLGGTSLNIGNTSLDVDGQSFHLVFGFAF